MRFPKKIDFSRTGFYALFGVAALFLQFVGDNGEPLSLALLYGVVGMGFSPTLSALCCAYPVLLFGEPKFSLLFFGQAALVALGQALQGKLRRERWRRSGVLALTCLALALCLFVRFAPFAPYALPLPHRWQPTALTQKILIAAAVLLFAAVFSVALKTLLRKFLRCKLRNDEKVFTLLFLLLVGVGACRFLGVNAYMGASFFILLVFASCTKNAESMLCAFALALPPLLVAQVSVVKLCLYGVAVSVAIKSGKVAAVCALLTVFFAVGYFEGLYQAPAARLVPTLLSALIPTLLFVLIPPPLLRGLENKVEFYREKHLTRVAINRNRAAIGEKLFEISAVFREIQAAFTAIGAEEAEAGAREYIQNCLLDEACKGCPQFLLCQKRNVFSALPSLIGVGCAKGRVTLIDLPRAVADACNNQSALLYALNRQLTEYQSYVSETENAASGRALLAGQAQGVSEILKSLALEQSEPLKVYAEKERCLCAALMRVGVVCSEVLLYGEEENVTLSLVSFGKADVKLIADTATRVLQTTMTISERLPLSDDKFCCILRKRPVFDAAFGVSAVKKHGQTASGDTHSVIRLDERKFMVALSDGMGSGEYAKRVSESTIALLESFYRAKMPSPLVLSSVNKLLTFGKEESFACVDVATVDLDSGVADIVKIGSPLAFILSGNTVKILESASLPLGILDALRPDASSYILEENDVLLFISDGVSDAFGSATDLYEALRNIPIHNPQLLAEKLIESGLRASGGVAKDDMTAVAVRLFKAA